MAVGLWTLLRYIWIRLLPLTAALAQTYGAYFLLAPAFVIYPLLFPAAIPRHTLLATLFVLYWKRDCRKAATTLLPTLIDLVQFIWTHLSPLADALAQWTLQVAHTHGPYFLLVAVPSTSLILLAWAMSRRGYYRAQKPPRHLTRAQLRHPVWNVFVVGLAAKGVLLRKLSPLLLIYL